MRLVFMTGDAANVAGQWRAAKDARLQTET